MESLVFLGIQSFYMVSPYVAQIQDTISLLFLLFLQSSLYIQFQIGEFYILGLM